MASRTWPCARHTLASSISSSTSCTSSARTSGSARSTSSWPFVTMTSDRRAGASAAAGRPAAVSSPGAGGAASAVAASAGAASATGAALEPSGSASAPARRRGNPGAGRRLDRGRALCGRRAQAGRCPRAIRRGRPDKGPEEAGAGGACGARSACRGLRSCGQAVRRGTSRPARSAGAAAARVCGRWRGRLHARGRGRCAGLGSAQPRRRARPSRVAAPRAVLPADLPAMLRGLPVMSRSSPPRWRTRTMISSTATTSAATPTHEPLHLDRCDHGAFPLSHGSRAPSSPLVGRSLRPLEGERYNRAMIDPAALRATMADLGQPPFRATQVYQALTRGLVTDFAAIGVLPARPARLPCRPPSAPQPDARRDPGHARPARPARRCSRPATVGPSKPSSWSTGSGRRCASRARSAARCAARFAPRARSGLARSLSAEEIVDQVLHFARELRDAGRKVTNVVFMGMGEPFHELRRDAAGLPAAERPRGLRPGRARRVDLDRGGRARPAALHRRGVADQPGREPARGHRRAARPARAAQPSLPARHCCWRPAPTTSRAAAASCSSSTSCWPA